MVDQWDQDINQDQWGQWDQWDQDLFNKSEYWQGPIQPLFFSLLKYHMIIFKKCLSILHKKFKMKRNDMCKVLAISGYKPFELGIFQQDHPSVAFIKLAIRKKIIEMIEDGLKWVLISGQLGVELWAAEVIFELQLLYPDVKLAVITPFLDQEKGWNEKNQEWYETILAGADYIDSVSKRGYEKPWQLRLKNQFFIEKSDGLLLLYDQEKEGSPKYLYEMSKKVQQQSYPVHLITFYDLQNMIDDEMSRQAEF
jgi:uncharacterized phage-like protein YoqJ